MSGFKLDLSVDIAGVKLRNPVILAAGPLGRDGETLKRAAMSGAGAVTTKTICFEAAKVPRPCLIRIPGGLLNCEAHSDLDYEMWVEREIPKAKEGGVPVIANIVSPKNKPREIEEITRGVTEAGADMVELVTAYTLEPLPKLVKAAKKATDVPVLVKISLETFEMKATWKTLERSGVDGISCLDSVGPCLAIDIESGEPILGSLGGGCRLSGSAIKPIAVYQVASLARAVKIPVIGIGGIMRGGDAVEMMMAGARAVSVCTAAIIKGPDVLGRIAREIASFMEKKRYKSVDEFVGLALNRIKKRERKGVVIYEGKTPEIIYERCNLCGTCERTCPYNAITIVDKNLSINENLCYGCGLCSTICPTGAIKRPY